MAASRLASVASFYLLAVAASWPLMVAGVARRGEEWGWLCNAAAMVAVGAVAVAHSRLAGTPLSLVPPGARPSLAPLWLATAVALRLPIVAALGPRDAGGVALQLLLNTVPALGEEVAWRAYLLGSLLRGVSPLRALLVHSVLWYLWHAPVILAAGGPATLLVGLLVAPLAYTVYAAAYLSAGVAGSALYHAAAVTLRDYALAAAPGALGWAAVLELAAGVLLLPYAIRGLRRVAG